VQEVCPHLPLQSARISICLLFRGLIRKIICNDTGGGVFLQVVTGPPDVVRLIPEHRVRLDYSTRTTSTGGCGCVRDALSTSLTPRFTCLVKLLQSHPHRQPFLTRKKCDLYFKFHGSVHRNNYSNIYPTRCNVTQYIVSGNCSTCFGWYFHPSSGAHTTLSTASGICRTVMDGVKFTDKVYVMI
jgi:hypothetical protein